MARSKYRINEGDRWFAHRWIEKKLENPASLGLQRTFDASRAFAGLEDHSSSQDLNNWCETWLTAHEWAQMKNAIRAGRRRARQPRVKSVTLSYKAWEILNYLAKRERCTISGVIEKRLGAGS